MTYLKLGRQAKHTTRWLRVFELMLESSLAENQGLLILTEVSSEWAECDPFQFIAQHFTRYLCQYHTRPSMYNDKTLSNKQQKPKSCFKSVANIPQWHTKWPDGRLTHQPSLPQSQHGGQHPTTQAYTWTWLIYKRQEIIMTCNTTAMLGNVTG